MSSTSAPRPVGAAAAVLMAIRAIGVAIASFAGGLFSLLSGAVGFIAVLAAAVFSVVSLLFRVVAAALERSTRLIAALIARIMPAAESAD